MKKVKSGLLLVLLILVICIPFCVIPGVKADSGWDSDYDSGGSWDSGSSWDSDYDSGSSWDSDYDYDYDYGGSSSSGDIDLFGLVLLVIIMAVIFSKIGRRSRPVIYHSPISKVNMYQDITQEHLTMVMPGANLHLLKKTAYDLFVEIQNAWMNFDYNKLRELCTDELYNSYVSQLETLKLKNGQNIMSNFENLGTKIIDIDEANGEFILTVFMNVEFYDYVINTTSKKVTRGNKNTKINNSYILTFIKGPDNSNDTKCPNCGAPIEHVTSGECEYCHSTIVKKASKFVLSKKTNVNK